jgi:hypothetical protein
MGRSAPVKLILRCLGISVSVRADLYCTAICIVELGAAVRNHVTRGYLSELGVDRGSVTSGVTVLHESVGPGALLGGLLIVTAVVIVLLRQGRGEV